jgi:hypothetical protein
MAAALAVALCLAQSPASAQPGPGVSDFNSVQQANTAAGVDACAKINAAIAAVGAGSTVDARGFTGTQAACSSGINIAVPLKLILGNASFTSTTDPVIHISSSNVTLQGAGGQKSQFTEATLTGNVIKIDPGLEDIEIQGLALYAPAKELDETNLDEGNCLMAGAGGSSDPPSAVIQRLNLHDNYCQSGNDGFVLRYVQNSRVVNNQFVSGATGLSQIVLLTSKRVSILNNLFHDSLGIANAVYAKPLGSDPNNGADHNTIANNVINGTFAFEMFNICGAFNSVIWNTLTDTAIANNSTCIDLTQPGLTSDTTSETHHNIVSDNTCHQTGRPTVANGGIAIVDLGSPMNLGANDNVIEGNTFTTPSNGITILNVEGGTHVGGKRNLILWNTIKITVGSRVSGIQINETSDVDNVLSKNTVVGATGNSYFLNGNGTIVVENQALESTAHASGFFVPANGCTNCVFRANTAANIKNGNGFGFLAGRTTGVLFGSDNHSLSNGRADTFGVSVSNSASELTGYGAATLQRSIDAGSSWLTGEPAYSQYLWRHFSLCTEEIVGAPFLIQGFSLLSASCL